MKPFRTPPTESISHRAYDAVRATVMDGSFYATLSCGKRWIEGGNYTELRSEDVCDEVFDMLSKVPQAVDPDPEFAALGLGGEFAVWRTRRRG